MSSYVCLRVLKGVRSAEGGSISNVGLAAWCSLRYVHVSSKAHAKFEPAHAWYAPYCRIDFESRVVGGNVSVP